LKAIPGLDTCRGPVNVTRWFYKEFIQIMSGYVDNLWAECENLL